MVKKRYNWLNPYISKIIIVRDHEDDKILDLARVRGFFTVVPPKKNRKLPWSYDKHLCKQRNNIGLYLLRLKCFRKVLTRYDKLDSIFISIIFLAFISSLFIHSISIFIFSRF